MKIKSNNLYHSRLVDTVQEGDWRLQPHALQFSDLFWRNFYLVIERHLKEFEVEVGFPVGGLGAHFRHQLVHNLLTLTPDTILSNQQDQKG